MFQSLKENKALASVLITLAVLTSAFMLVKTVHVVMQALNFNEPVPYEKQLSFEGVGKVYGVPNIANITIGMETKQKDLVTAQEANTKSQNKLLEEIKALNIESADIKTTSYNVYPWTEWDGTNNKTLEKGWIVNQQIAIKVRDLKNVAKVLEVAGKNQSTSITGPNFTIDDLSNLKAEARLLAIKDAKAKAEVASKELGIDLGKIVGYWETTYDPMPYNDYGMARTQMGGGGDMMKEEMLAPMIEAGTNEIQVNASISYKIEE